MRAATRRASCRSSIVQQVPKRTCPSRWSYSCIERPITSWPCRARSAAATDESTPPDMATTMRISQCCNAAALSCQNCECWKFRLTSAAATVSIAALPSRPRERAQLFDDCRQLREQVVHLGVGVAGAEAEANGVLRPVRRGIPWRAGRATARAFPTSTPIRSTPRRLRGRARSAATRLRRRRS